MEAAFFCLRCEEVCSSDAIPGVMIAGGGEGALGIGGAVRRSHFRCTSAPRRFVRNAAYPPARNENLMICNEGKRVGAGGGGEAGCNGVWHISHIGSDGWLRNVQRGHDVVSFVFDAGVGIDLGVASSIESSCDEAGLIPQLWQGGTTDEPG